MHTSGTKPWKYEGVAQCHLMEEPEYPAMQPSGLQLALVGPERGYPLVGGRGNLAGPVKFSKLVDAYKLGECVQAGTSSAIDSRLDK